MFDMSCAHGNRQCSDKTWVTHCCCDWTKRHWWWWWFCRGTHDDVFFHTAADMHLIGATKHLGVRLPASPPHRHGMNLATLDKMAPGGGGSDTDVDDKSLAMPSTTKNIEG